jgi:hypothetical protein
VVDNLIAISSAMVIAGVLSETTIMLRLIEQKPVPIPVLSM